MKNSLRPRTRILILSLAAALAIGAIATFSWSAQSAPQEAAAQQTKSIPETTMNDQTDLALTVYNSNIALVRDTRELSLPAGEFQLRFSDIAASINPATVHLRPLAQPEKLSVLEQNYEYDLLDPQKLLQKYVGREVTMLHRIQKDGSTIWQEEKATLLADNESPVWKINGEIVTGLSAEGYRFPSVPANLYSTPTLLWTLANSGAAHQKVEASYLAGNISWSADYVLNVSRDDATAGIDGWVTLVNNSGTEFRNAHLQLVAGELNRVPEAAGVAGGLCKSRAEMTDGPAADAAGKFLRISSLHACSHHHSFRQGIETNQHARCAHISRAENLRRQRTVLLLSQPDVSRSARARPRLGFL